MKKIAILYIATGRYIVFWEDFYKNAKENLLQKCNVHYFLFTDNDEITAPLDVTIIKKPFYPWPEETLRRFETFLSISEELEKYDYIYFFNANLMIVSPINEDILPDDKDELVVCLHPGYCYCSPPHFPYERRKNCTAYIAQNEGEHYACGGLNGGRAKDFIEMCSVLYKNIEIDKNNKIIAVWHDESHLNKYIIGKRVKWLGEEYLTFEKDMNNKYKQLRLQRKPKILIRDKASKKYGGHSYLRSKA